jgi:hypothetical protein
MHDISPGWAELLPENGLTGEKLLAGLTSLQAHSVAIKACQESFKADDAIERVLAAINAYRSKP